MSQELKKIIEQVLAEMSITPNNTSANTSASSPVITNNTSDNAPIIDTGMIPDITKYNLKEQYLVKNPQNKEAYLDLKKHSPARLGISRAGSRYKTETSLRFRADHSAAQDAVFSFVSEDFLKECDLFTTQSKCVDKDEYVTRPDLGKKLTDESIELIKQKCKKNPTVQIVIADGLSSSAIEANIKDILPALVQGLNAKNIDVGTPFFVKLGRVGVMDVISEITGAQVTCLLVGERPGLVTAESMSAYIAYKATVDMPEARRTVISNIHKGGTIAAEAGAHIADIIKMMLDKKASGTDLRL